MSIHRSSSQFSGKKNVNYTKNTHMYFFIVDHDNFADSLALERRGCPFRIEEHANKALCHPGSSTARMDLLRILHRQ